MLQCNTQKRLPILRQRKSIDLWNNAEPDSHLWPWLCVLASGYLQFLISIFGASIRKFSLHLGQNSGKLLPSACIEPNHELKQLLIRIIDLLIHDSACNSMNHKITYQPFCSCFLHTGIKKLCKCFYYRLKVQINTKIIYRASFGKTTCSFI